MSDKEKSEATESNPRFSLLLSFLAKRKKADALLVLAFLAFVFGVGFLQPIADLVRRERPQVLDVFTRPPSEKNLRAYEKDMEDASLLIKALRPNMQFAQYIALNDLGRDGVVGRDGWLFYKPDVRFVIEPWDGCAQVVTAVKAFRDDLNARGIRLVVVPAPGKPSVYPAQLAARAADLHPPVHAHADEAIAQLKQAGLDVVDLFALFDAHSTQTPLYLQQDTHWSPEGMQLAAHEVAAHLLASNAVTQGSVSFTLKPVTIERHGDVVRMARSPHIEKAYKPESVHCSQVIRDDTGKPYESDPASEVLVLGDSFLRIYERDEPGSAGFTAHLSNELKMPVASIINDGGASTLVRQELSRKPRLLHNKKVVIWEFVERDLRFGTEGWKEVSLPDPS